LADVNEIIEESILLTWNELKYKATIHKEYGTVPHILCNAGELKQVFINLFVNASHALSDKGDITARTILEENSVRIEIADTGIGIPHDNLRKIFDPFFTTKPVGKGTGLGLWITSIIVAKHNGTITAESIIGKGTTFILTLPITQAQ
jgi:two-component system NtrC family sensor kinase